MVSSKARTESHSLSDLKWIVIACMVVSAVTFGALSAPLILTSFLALVIWAAVVWKRPGWMFHLTLICGFTALPSFVPTVIATPVGGLFLFEPVLFGAVLACLGKTKAQRLPWQIILFFLAAVLAWVIGLYATNQTAPMISDVRPMVDVVLGVIAGVNAFRFVTLRSIIKTSKIILWFSLALTLAASFGVVELVGRSEVASLQGATVGAERLITPATYFALAVVCGALAALVTKTMTNRDIVMLALPAAAILFVSFSRNNLVAVGVALFWVFVATGTPGTRIAAALRLILGAALVGISVGGVVYIFNPDWLQTQVTGFSERVLDGLTSDGISNDGSAQFRVQENEQIIPVIGQSPIWGHGFGSSYKAAYGPSTYFTATTAPYYAHNYFLWLMLKGGLILTAAFLALTVHPIVSSFRSRRPGAVITSAVLLAFLVVSTIAPMPNGFPTGALFGLILGAAYAASRHDAAANHAISPSSGVVGLTPARHSGLVGGYPNLASPRIGA